MSENEVSDTLFSFILENVLLRLNITKDTANYDYIVKLLTSYINQICKEITIQTNRINFPSDLKYLVIDLCIDFYNTNNLLSNANDNQAIQSMSETGRSVSFGIPASTQAKLNLVIQDQLTTRKTLINRYRLLYKVRCPKEDDE